MIKSFYAILILTLLSRCQDDPEKYESINKLRAVGVESSPMGTIPSTTDSPRTVQLTFHVFNKQSETLDIQAYVDSNSSYAIPIEIQNISAPTETAYNGLIHYQFTASVIIPTAESLPGIDKSGFISLRYGAVVRAGAEEEKIVGNIVVYKEENEFTARTAPTIAITNPTVDSTVPHGEVELKSTITANYDENWRVSWFH